MKRDKWRERERKDQNSLKVIQSGFDVEKWEHSNVILLFGYLFCKYRHRLTCTFTFKYRWINRYNDRYIYLALNICRRL